MINVGLAGIGFMGWIHRLAYQQTDGICLAGFCSRSQAKRAGDWTAIAGNFGPPGEQIDVSKMHVFESLDELIADDSIDLIDICLPPHLHADAIERALAGGKDVLCEKPLALSAEVAHRLASISGENATSGRLYVAHILPFMNEYQFLLGATIDERFGKLRSMRLKRFISPPDWIPDFYDPDQVGGPLIDLHVHDAHLIRMLMGMPDEIHSAADHVGDQMRRYESLMTFADGRYVSSGGGVIDAPGRAFTHGYEAMFDRATVQFEFAAYTNETSAAIPLVVLHNDGQIETPDLGDPDPVAAFARQATALATAVSSGETPKPLDPSIAADAIRIAQQQRPTT